LHARPVPDPEIVRLPLTSHLDGLAKDILNATGAKNIVCVVEVVAGLSGIVAARHVVSPG